MKLRTTTSLLRWLLLVTFFNSVVFMILVPIWQAPDEQAHFAQVQYLGEFGKLWPKTNYDKNLSQEVLLSETLLGTLRDGTGRNKFTLRPAYNLEYTGTTIGKYENTIARIPKAARKTMVKIEATRYPPIYYYTSAVFYRIGYPLGLVGRVMVTRIPSIFMGVVMVYFSFRLASLIFPRNSLAAYSSAVAVSFQPMFSFLTSGVNSDNLMNPLFTVFLYLCALVIHKRKLSRKLAVALALSLLALKFTKPHYVIALPIAVSLLLFIPRQTVSFIKRNLHRVIITFVLLVAIVVFMFPGLPAPEVKIISAITQPNFPNITLIEHLNWTLRHTIAEVIPWYWGVFKWLGVTLPRSVNRVVNRVMAASAIGIIVWLFNSVRRRRWGTQEKLVAFLMSSSAIYFIALMLWDWLFRRSNNFSFGMQGRYYFPTLAPHMILLVFGLLKLVPQKLKKLRVLWLKIIGVSAITLNFIGMYSLARSYYDLSSISTFLIQVSQYKPIYFKSPWVLIWFAIYLIVLVAWTLHFILYAANTRSRT